MFNLLLALITGLIIGWNFHAFFLQLNPPNIFKNEINIVQLTKQEKIQEEIILPRLSIEEIKENIQILKRNIPQELSKEKNISTPKIEDIKKVDTFYDYLHHDLFSDAMSLYIDASEAKLLFYHATLLQFFETKVEKNPQKALEEMLEFQELEANERKIDIATLYEIEDNNYEEKAKILLNLIKEKIGKKENSIKEKFTSPLTIVQSHITSTNFQP